MIVLTVGSCSYENEIYEYRPINVQGYINALTTDLPERVEKYLEGSNSGQIYS